MCSFRGSVLTAVVRSVATAVRPEDLKAIQTVVKDHGGVLAKHAQRIKTQDPRHISGNYMKADSVGDGVHNPRLGGRPGQRRMTWHMPHMGGRVSKHRNHETTVYTGIGHKLPCTLHTARRAKTIDQRRSRFWQSTHKASKHSILGISVASLHLNNTSKAPLDSSRGHSGWHNSRLQHHNQAAHPYRT